MKYAVVYDNSFKYLDKVNEIIIRPETFKYDWIDIINFVKTSVREDQQVIIDLERNWFSPDMIIKQDLPFLIELNKIRNIKIIIRENSILSTYLKENNIKFFFAFIIKDKDDLYKIIQKGVCDIYIGGNLLNNLGEIQNIRKHDKINIRVYPNRNLEELGDEWPAPAFNSWIRPEDTEVYEKYIDVFEFVSNDRTSVIFDIYYNRKWEGRIKDIIIDCPIDTLNELIPPNFAKFRTICHKKCVFKSCNFCERAIATANSVQEVLDKARKEN